MEKTQSNPRQSRHTPNLSSTKIANSTLKRQTGGQINRAMHLITTLALIGGIITCSLILFLISARVDDGPTDLQLEQAEEAKPLSFEKDITVTGVPGKIVTVNIKCQQFCTCLFYTGRKYFQSYEYNLFWNVSYYERTRNMQVIHIDHTDSDNENNSGYFFVLKGSPFYEYNLSCGQRSLKNKFPIGNTISHNDKPLFSPIATYSSPIVFIESPESLLKKSKILYELKTNPDKSQNRLVRHMGKMVSYIIPKEYKEKLKLKAGKITPLAEETPTPETGAETKSEDDSNEEDKQQTKSTETIEKIATSLLFDTELIYKSKNPSVVKITGWLPRSLHLTCLSNTENENVSTSFSIEEPSTPDSETLASPYEKVTQYIDIRSFDLKDYSKVSYATRRSDTFTDLNNSSPVKFIIKLVGLTPGQHTIYCGVENIDSYQYKSLSPEGSSHSPKLLKALEVKVTIPTTDATITRLGSSEDDNAETKKEVERFHPKLAKWFESLGYLNFYLLFDIDEIIKTKNQKEGKTRLKEMVFDIKEIINGNLFGKSVLDRMHWKIGEEIRNKENNEQFINKLRFLRNKTIVLISLMKNLTLLSTVPVDSLADRNFDYYSNWEIVEKNLIAFLNSNVGENTQEASEEDKKYIENLRSYTEIIVGHVYNLDLFNERKALVNAAMKGLYLNLGSLTGCGADSENKLFSDCFFEGALHLQSYEKFLELISRLGRY